MDVNIYPIRGGGGIQRHVRIDSLYLHDNEHEPKLTLRGYLPIPSLVLDVDEKPPLRAATSKMLAAASPRRRNAVLSPRVERPQVLSSGSEDWSGVSAGDPSVPAQTPSQPPRAASSSSRLNSKCRRGSNTSSTLNSMCRTPLEVGRRSEGHLIPGGGRHDHGNARSRPNSGTHDTRGEGTPYKEGAGSSVPPLTPAMGAQNSRFTRTAVERHARAHDTLAHDRNRFADANPGWSANPGVSILRRVALHSPVVMPLVVGCSVEAWVSEPSPGTRTLLLHVPVRNYIWGVL